MRKKFYILALVFGLWLMCSGFAPAGAYYLDVDTQQLGNIRVYVNYAYSSDYFTTNTVGSTVKPVLLYNSYISGYVLTSGGTRQYELRIYPYAETWQYRLVNSNNYTWYDLSVISVDVDNSSIAFVGSSVSHQDSIYYLILFFAGAILLGVWRCARK